MIEESYRIIRFKHKGPSSRVIKKGLTLKEAQKHCNDPSTRGQGWFDGYSKEVKK